MILTVLNPETISEVSDIIRAPPAQDKYTTLKDAIVARLTDSPDTQLHKLLGTIELGDKKPSQLLLQMRTLAGARASNDILRVRWLDLLPDSTRRLLTIIKNQTIDELAAVADELHAVGPSVMATEVGRPRSRPASPGGAASSNSNSVGAQEIAELRAAIVQLTENTREALRNVEISLEVALARELNHARSHDLAHQHRIEARPRGTAGTTRDTATWAEQCRGSRVCSHPKARQETSITIERRLYVTDRTHKIRFLIDSGSVLSILPRTVVRKPLQRKTLELQAANGTTIATYGQHSLTLNLGLRRPFEWAFTIARVDVAIIGADLLSHFGLLIDLRNRRLLDNQTSLSTSCQVGPAPQVHTISVAATGVPVGPCVDAYDAILAEFASDKARPGEMATIVDFPVQHRIVTSGQPVFAPPASAPRRRSTRSREGRIQEAARSGHHQAFIEPVGQSIAPRAEAWKHLEDHGRLPLAQRPYSTGSTPSAYHRGLASRERRQGLFRSWDLYKAFYQIPVAEEDISKTAVTTPFGLFEFVAHDELPPAGSGLRALLPGRHPRALSASHEQHLQHLRELLTILKRARLFVNWEKCQIGRSEVVFAGYLISERGFEPPAAKVEAIARFPKPSDSTQLRRFIGMLNFYRRCLPRAAELMSPLTDLLRGLQKKKEKLAWSAQADEAFERIKQAMASAVRSAFYHPGQPLALHTDASNTAIGAALSQRHADDDWTPLGFFSQKLSPTQQRYSTYDRELLAIFEAIKYFQRILEGRSFTIMTDHRPLSFALEQKSDKFSPRQSRQLDFISRFDTKIVYTPGDENPVADALSRIDAITMPTTLNSAQISAEQQKDEQLTHLRGKAKTQASRRRDRRTFPCLRRAAKRPEAIPTRESTSTGFRHGSHSLSSERQSYREASRAAILLAVDEQGHRALGEAMQRNWEISSHRTADSIMCTSTSSRCLFTRISKLPHDDRPLHTRWPQAIPIGDMSAQTVAKAFFHGWISFLGTPLTITTDQGAQFEGKLLAQLCKLSVQSNVHTSPYHPQANSMVERMHRTLKAALKCSPETPWTLALPGVLLGLRTTFKEDCKRRQRHCGDGFRHVATHTRGVRRTTRTGQNVAVR
ncbi:unnamed protein product, partial [Trichogramma brassicae]